MSLRDEHSWDEEIRTRRRRADAETVKKVETGSAFKHPPYISIGFMCFLFYLGDSINLCAKAFCIWMMHR